MRVRLAGIGGTGVVTTAQMLGTAAMLDGWEVQGLDQTGLSQKAGPVISDVVLTRGVAASTNLIGDGQTTTLLALDGLVGASDPVLAWRATPRARGVVLSTTRTPTGRMVSEPTIGYPADDVVLARLAAVSRADGCWPPTRGGWRGPCSVTPPTPTSSSSVRRCRRARSPSPWPRSAGPSS